MNKKKFNSINSITYEQKKFNFILTIDVQEYSFTMSMEKFKEKTEKSLIKFDKCIELNKFIKKKLKTVTSPIAIYSFGCV